ncbi:MAG: TlpA disulfide reductase family protein [Candidatus Poribacteria bacterium]|nr:TlpA disulfide reductase family protein [Candidatus Poribacteria bacterium]
MSRIKPTVAAWNGAIVALCVAAALVVGCRNAADENPDAELSEESLGVAPDFTLPDFNGNPVSLSDFKGKRIIVNFWGTWCPPCVAETPDLVALYEANKDKEFVVIGIAVGDTVESVSAFAAEYRVTYPLLVGNDKEVYDLSRKFGGADYLPTTYVLDKDGKIVRKLVGQQDRSAFDRLLRALDWREGRLAQDEEPSS